MTEFLWNQLITKCQKCLVNPELKKQASINNHQKLSIMNRTCQKTIIASIIAVLAALMPVCAVSQQQKATNRIVAAYVTAGSDIMPDPSLLTHINYAFGGVADSFDSLRISNPDRLDQIVALKAQKPSLKVVLSIGGWTSGNFSEMAADSICRTKFVKSCMEAVERHKLDGIDIDWEYPTSSAAGISSSPDDTKNFSKLMRDLRKALGDERLLTFASVWSARFVDWHEVLKYVDFVNVMSYDMGRVPNHHSALRNESPRRGSIEKAVNLHIEAGVTPDRLVMGLAFYGKGTVHPENNGIQKYKEENNLTEGWNEVGQFAYLANDKGEIVYTYDTAKSLKAKCEYANERNLLGAMYWEYSCNNADHSLSRAVWQTIMQ